MIVYIEDCLIENFVVTFLILKCVSSLLKLELKKGRLILSCLFASLCVVTYPLLDSFCVLLILFKICVSIIIVIIAFRRKIVASYIAFIFLTALYAGINILIYYIAYGTLDVKDNFPTYILLFILLATYYIISCLVKLLQKSFVISNFVYDVKIMVDGNEFKDKAFLDSGNTLVDENFNPVFVINFKLFKKIYKDINFDDLLVKNFKNLKNPHYIKSNFASGKAKLLVFTVDALSFKSGDKNFCFQNASIALSYSKFDKNFNCNMLLNANAFV